MIQQWLDAIRQRAQAAVHLELIAEPHHLGSYVIRPVGGYAVGETWPQEGHYDAGANAELFAHARPDLLLLLGEVTRLTEEKHKLRLALAAYAHAFVFDNYRAGIDTAPWLLAQAALAACPPESEVDHATPDA